MTLAPALPDALSATVFYYLLDSNCRLTFRTDSSLNPELHVFELLDSVIARASEDSSQRRSSFCLN